MGVSVKYVFGIVVGLLLMNSARAIAGEKDKHPKDTLSCLMIGGRFSIPAFGIKDIKVYLYLDNERVDSAKVNGDKEFSFLLKKNNVYSIEMIKDGYFTRSISVNTVLADRVVISPPFIFEFTMDMRRKINVIDDYYLDFPIATIAFNSMVGKFDYSRKYTAHIKGKMKQSENGFMITKSK